MTSGTTRRRSVTVSLGGAQKGVIVVKEGGNLVVAVHEIILKCFV